MVRAAALFLVCSLCACADDFAPNPSDRVFGAEPYDSLIGQNRTLYVSLRTAPQPPTRGVVDLEYTVTGPDGGTVDGLNVDVNALMPEMAHGGSEAQTVTALGLGRYLVSNVYLAMPGRWEVRTQFTGPYDDSAIFSFQIP